MLTGLTINGDRVLSAELNTPDKPTAVVIFSHGSGSGRNSIRNQAIAQILRDYGFATLLVDLLTQEEQESDERTQRIACRVPGMKLNKFNIELLTDRLIQITQEIQFNAITKGLKIVYFGSSTGAAAALFAAADFRSVKALIARGGRTDLVDKNTLLQVTSPCLFIAGSNDKMVIQANKKTIIELASVKDKRLEIVKHASHLFEEDGKIEEVGVIAGRWLVERL
jgi:putative phosphoribosyl transferase